MKTNKLSLLAVLALGGLVAFGTLAKAADTKPEGKPPGDQQTPPRGGDMKERQAKMAEELGLSEDQKTKMADVRKEQGEKRKALNEDTTLSKEDKQAKMKSLREESETKVKGILTAEQYAKWEKMRPTGGPRGPRGEGKPPGDKPADAPKP